MTSTFDPESIDLAKIAAVLRDACGPSLEGAIVGRTHLRDEVARHLECSQLDAEGIVDTMVARGFLAQRQRGDGRVEWAIPTR